MGAYCKAGFRNLILLLLAAWTVTGCNPSPTSSKQLYENAEAGIRLEQPENWDLAYSERNGTIALIAEEGVWAKKSVRIEILGPACGPDMSGFQSPEEEVEWNIYRIGMLYELESVTLLQEPMPANTEDYEITKAIISIPTTAMLDDTARIQVGDQGPDVFQTVELFAITSNDHTTMAYIYLGTSEKLNTQAQAVIGSIQLVCLAEE